MSSLHVIANENRAAETRYAASDIALYDDFLTPEDQKAVLAYLRGPGWGYGAFSDPTPDAPRYWYKHFAGYVKDGLESHDLGRIEGELDQNAPLAAQVWKKIQATILPGHTLTRCYANGYPFGAEGGLHMDSNIRDHFTALYYPHLTWHPNYAGETVFFNETGTEILASIYPKPNRLMVFPGTIPHVARAVSRKCPELRITLMFKTATR